MRSMSKLDIVLYLVLICSVVTGIILRMSGYLNDSFWYDEVASFELAQYSLGDFFCRNNAKRQSSAVVPDYFKNMVFNN